MSSPKNDSLQHQMAELDQLLEWFDRDDIDLDEALKKFDEGVTLTEKLKERLSTLENKITILKERFDQDTA